MTTRCRVDLVPEAEEELGAAAAWYEGQRIGLGVELVALVDEAIAEIALAPLSWPQWRGDRPFRRRVLERFPYVIFYSASEVNVRIMAIAHAKRRPGYWLSRV